MTDEESFGMSADQGRRKKAALGKDMEESNTDREKHPARPGILLRTNKLFGVFEILAVFAAAVAIIFAGLPFAGENLFAKQLVIFLANIGMLLLVWLGLHLRGESWKHFGLSSGPIAWRPLLKGILQAAGVLVFAVAAFILGAIIMANIVGQPQQADVSGYNFLKGNLPLLVVSLLGIYFVSSFGEEVIYRGFLINRISELGGRSGAALVAAVLISAAIFGLAHIGWGVTGVVQTTLMGLALALSYLFVKRNLWVLVAAHAVMDTMLIVPLYFA